MFAAGEPTSTVPPGPTTLYMLPNKSKGATLFKVVDKNPLTIDQSIQDILKYQAKVAEVMYLPPNMVYVKDGNNEFIFTRNAVHAWKFKGLTADKAKRVQAIPHPYYPYECCCL